MGNKFNQPLIAAIDINHQTPARGVFDFGEGDMLDFAVRQGHDRLHLSIRRQSRHQPAVKINDEFAQRNLRAGDARGAALARQSVDNPCAIPVAVGAKRPPDDTHIRAPRRLSVSRSAPRS